MLLAHERTKLDPSDDALFYEYPRFVTHVDDGFIRQLTNLYSDRLKPHTRILDLMSSWVSHLPETMKFNHVEGHGLNAEELQRNPRLDHFFVQNLNQNLNLPFTDCEFDAILNTVSVQYLQYPDAIFTEIYRILKPNGIAIISFSNRMFYQKAIQAWRDSSEQQRVELVKAYFKAVKGFSEPEVVTANSHNLLWQWLNPSSGDPFYAVIATKVLS
ncbi:methylase involved in ubiquinone/menaquinone biosynthesis [Synechococcus sp. PCC 7502]|uniref:class I SAM-dependent methyltransferase n=1 Tax=Synechococcus sp. PCC 7502 TaxID=1173263 RepID=UPI00029FA70F|nr:methyltransferase domain-containing protein [Synechococcus sp. PCC 7502]AFY74437.1 methylase involved in ubiquinone/menaquinone biosynthesis [Synechococcus sp. PCC 7502]